jgi:predicted nucleotidyltransferase
MKAVTDAVLEEMTRRLVEEFQREQVILFGSYAWGAPDPYSDVDLMVIVDQSDLPDYERSLRAHRCLSEVDVPKDVIVKTRAEFDFFRQVRASLEHKIGRQGKVLYERSQAAARAELAGVG